MAEFKPQTYRNAAGQERRVTSVDGAVAAEWDGFYAPDSPTGKRLTAQRAAETRRANAEAKPAKPASNGRRARGKATAKTPTRDAVEGTGTDSLGPDTPEEAAQSAAAIAPTP